MASSNTKRVAKKITNQEVIDYFVNTRPEDLTMSKIMDYMGEYDGETHVDPYDLITVPKGKYGVENTKRGFNKNEFTTEVGKLLFNKLYIERNPTIFEAFGWIDDTVTKKVFGSLYQKIGYLMIEGKIDQEDMRRFAMTTQLTMPMVQFLSPGFTDKMLLSSKEITKKKNELLKKYKAELDAGNIKVADEIQKELLAFADEYLKDDPSMDIFRSGAGGSFTNNYKNMFIMRGTVRDTDPNVGYQFITSNYIDGVSVDEYAAFANTLAEGPYFRSKKTEVGGYWEKLFLYGLQHLQLGEPGSDCGTDKYIEVDITKDNIDAYMYNYIIEGSKLVELTSENRDKYIGKRVKMRFASMCKMKNGFCNKCAGNLWYRLGVKSVGVITPQIPSKLKNIYMKGFHDAQVSLTDINVMEAFMPDSVLSESTLMEEAIPED